MSKEINMAAGTFSRGVSGMYHPITLIRFLLLVLLAALLVSCDRSTSSSGDSPDSPKPQNDLPTDYLPLSDLSGASFSATRLAIVSGESSVLSWSVPEATNVSLLPLSDSVEPAGEQTVSPTENTQYLLLAQVAGSSEPYGQLIAINVQAVAAVELLANLDSGSAPLTVRFTPNVSSITNISRYYWDFDGDGGPEDGGLGIGAQGFDTLDVRTGSFSLTEYDTIGRPLTYTFEKAGIYTTRIRVWDDDGNQADSTVTIEVINAPPVIDELYISSSEAAGQVPLSTTFEVSASDADGIASVEWDLDGNGTYDITSEVQFVRDEYTSQLQTVYENPGVFNPAVRVTDSTGLSSVSSAPSIRVEASANPIPLVSAPGSIGGEAPYQTSFLLQISHPGLSDLVAAQIDFDGDGTFDKNYELTSTVNSITVEHLYESAGVFYLYIEALAEDGSIGKRYVEVIIDANHTIAVSNNAIDPLAGELAAVDIILGGASASEVVIVDEDGQTVNAIGANQTRASGEYSFTWDGRNQAGDIAKPGIYYALLRYQTGDAEFVLDLRDEHAVVNYYPSISVSRAQLQEGIQPFANKPIVYPFTLDNYGINRLTAYITQTGVEVLASSASIFRARYVEDGDYTIDWLGDGITGKLVPVVENFQDFYVPGVIAESVAANAILLTHETTIDDVTVDKPIFHPPLLADGATSAINFSLSHTASVQLSVANTDSGAEVLRKTFTNIAAGNASVSWDGRDNAGNLLAPAGYRLQLVAFGPYGDTSLPAAVMQRIRY